MDEWTGELAGKQAVGSKAERHADMYTGGWIVERMGWLVER